MEHVRLGGEARLPAVGRTRSGLCAGLGVPLAGAASRPRAAAGTPAGRARVVRRRRGPRHGAGDHRQHPGGRRVSFTEFETGQVRPLALSPNGSLLFACNTPDNRLEIFRVADAACAHVASVPVGPRAGRRRRRGDDEVWVVNHLSDSVSIVDARRPATRASCARCSSATSRATSCSPGPDRSRAFITTAHRGQNTGRDPQLTTPGVGRADVWVFDAEQPRAIARRARRSPSSRSSPTRRARSPCRPDGEHASTRRASTPATRRRRSTSALVDATAAGLPAPATERRAASPQPPDGRSSSSSTAAHWVDEHRHAAGTTRSSSSLPDKDVFAIDATANPPAADERGRLHGRRHRPLQHGRQPGEREGLRLQHRRAQRRALRGARRLRRGVGSGARAHRRQPHHGPRPGAARVDAAPPQHAHRLHRSDGTPNARAAKSLAFPTEHGGHRATARRSTSPRSGRARSASSTRAQLETDTFAPDAGQPDRRQRRRADRPRARRAPRPALRAHALRQLRSRSSTPREQAGDRRTSRCSTRSRRASPTAAASSTTRDHSTPRRPGVRELPHLRRLRRPRVGPRQPRRARRQPIPGPFTHRPASSRGSPGARPDLPRP